jgi:serine/threonine protein kinase/Tol biopolymer transport system component/tetratricopeptide (TPR) repeat protein
VTAERWEQVKNLFESALGVHPGDRRAFLDRECGDDEELRREVASLLDSHDQSGQFLESPVVSLKSVIDVPDTPPDAETGDPLIGRRIGAYELVRAIGRGGMGAVYLATRADNEFQKRVAIKLIRSGLEADFLVKRFRHERQILAHLEHPNIARLLDGGTSDGMPYFVMELVEGEPLIQYCESRSLPLKARLDIFLLACSAVHYAHRRMIVHRDLKPGNILVKPDGAPKLLDFGIAKLLDPDTSDVALETTLAGFRIATPAYASPEQMRGEPATVRSDVYALGIILFELITGHRPVATPGADPLAIQDTTTDDSTRLLTRQLRSVVHRAVQPDPSQRYDSVEALTADIQRALAGIAIPNYAAAPTAFDTVTQVSPGSVAVLPFRLLGADSTSDGYLGIGITDALITKLSNVGRISVRSTSAVTKYAAVSDPVAAGRELGVEHVLEGRIQKLGERVRVTVQLVEVKTGSPVWAASFDEQFEDLLRVEDSISEQVARALVPQLTGEEREQLARAGTASAKAHKAYLRGRWQWSKGTDESLAQALVAFMQAIAEDPQYARAHAGVADYYVQLGIRGGLPPSESFAAAKESAHTALKIDPSLAEAHASLGFATWAYDRDAAAAAHHFQLAIALNPDYAPAHHWLGLLNSSRLRPEMAIACLERARKLDPNRPIYAADLALCFYNSRRFDKAIEVCRKALHTLGEDPELYSMMALSYRQQGEYDEAGRAARRMIELTHQDVFSLAVLAEIESARGEPALAKSVLAEVEKRAQNAYVSGCVLALLLLACGRRDAALEQLERSWRDRDWWIMWLATGPSWDPIRGEPRFQRLLPAEGPQPARLPSAPEHVRPAARPSRRNPRRAWIGVAAAIVVIAAAAGYWLSRPKPAPFQRPAITKLTTNGTAIMATVSPDARYVAYTTALDGRPVLWVRELDGSAAYRIAGPYDGPIRALEFIRNGQYVSFVSYAQNEPARSTIFAAPIGGGAVETLLSGVPGPASVSPDGSHIAYYRFNPQKGGDELIVVGPDRKTERLIASRKHPDRFTWTSAPAWSDDGQRIACALEGSDQLGFRVELAVFDLDGSMRRVKSPRWQYVGGLDWMKDRRGLLVIGQEKDSSFQQIWYAPLSGDALRLSNDLNDYQSIGISGDGASLVSVQVQTLTNVYILRVDDPAHGEQITPGSGRYFDLSWTPDNKIIYASDASGQADIWIMNADGSGQRQLTHSATRSYSPAVSPDGRTVVFHSNRGGNWNIWKMDRDNRTPVQLTSGTRDSNWPQFSRDGKFVLFHHTGLNAMFNIWRVPVSGGIAEQLTSHLTMHPAVSPKDGSIACWFSADVAKPVWKIAIYNPDGSGPVKWFDTAPTVRPDSALHWMPKGDGISYSDDRSGVSNIWVQPIDGRPPRRLTTFTWGTVYSFDWAPDGRLAYSRGMSTSDVVLIRDRALPAKQ